MFNVWKQKVRYCSDRGVLITTILFGSNFTALSPLSLYFSSLSLTITEDLIAVLELFMPGRPLLSLRTRVAFAAIDIKYYYYNSKYCKYKQYKRVNQYLNVGQLERGNNEPIITQRKATIQYRPRRGRSERTFSSNMRFGDSTTYLFCHEV